MYLLRNIVVKCYFSFTKPWTVVKGDRSKIWTLKNIHIRL